MYRMLLVDDREVFLRTVRRMPFFREHTDEIKIEWECRSADRALALLRREQVDLVMTDIRMPMMSGIDLLKAIRTENLCSCVILMSEYTDFAYAREGILYGAFDYIVKPIEDEMMESAMLRALAHLQSLDMTREKETAAAEQLAGIVFKGTAEELKTQIEALEAHVLAEKDPIEMQHMIRKIRNHLLQSLLREYPFLEMYVPLKELLVFNDTKPDTDIRAVFRQLRKRLAFLHSRRNLFYTASANMQVHNVWFYTIGAVEETCRLTETADRFFLNPSYLSSLFKKETGISYKSFVQDLKIERARYLLGFTDMKVSEIAARLHFTDTEYFRKTFKAGTGVPPAKFDYQTYVDGIEDQECAG